MRPFWTVALILTLICAAFAIAQNSPVLREKRQGASDLELSGELVGLPPESTRFITRDELLAMPQVNLTITGDPNFSGPTKIRGLKLEDLVRRFAASPSSAMVVAICDDGYRANYPPDYIAAHHPVVVLQVNGEPPSGWPKAAEDRTSNMGPYMITNAKFTPSFKVLAHADEAQIPWGVVRLEIREEKAVFGAIVPSGPSASDREVQDGFRIASQNCFRCHDTGGEGGRKAGRSWEMLAAMAAASPNEFAAYIRAPLSQNPQTQMPANPQYDDATLAAITAYFRTFSKPAKP
jgi:mono/diheme cytochrome c family protein